MSHSRIDMVSVRTVKSYLRIRQCVPGIRILLITNTSNKNNTFPLSHSHSHSLSLSLWSGIVYFLPASVFTYKCTFVRFVRHSNRHGVPLLLLLPVRLATPSNLEAFEKYPFTRRSPRTNVYINASECLLNSHFPFLRLSAGCRIMSQNSSAHCSDASQGGRAQFDLRNTDAPCERSWRIFT